MIPSVVTSEPQQLPHLSHTGISAREYDGNGWAEIRGNPISKVGVFEYLGKSIDPVLEPERIYKVLRPEESLNNFETIKSFRLVPWIDDHPTRLLGPEEAGRVPAEKKGVQGTTGEEIYYSEGVLYANLKVFSEDLEDVIDSGKRELSVGYSCRYELSSGIWNGIHYDAIQRDIRGNHLATVTEGRMGPDVAVLDHMKFSLDAKDIKMADDPKKDEDVELSAEQVSEFLNKFGKDQAKLRGMIDKHFGSDASKEDDMNKGCDEDEEKKKEKEAADKAAKDAEEKEKSAKDAEEKKDKEASDARAKSAMDTVEKIKADVEEWKKNGVKNVMKEIKQRDILAQQIAGHHGSFDASEMTLGEVAQYGIKKAGLKCDAGQEVTVLSAYFTDRPAPARQVAFAIDSSEGADASEKSISDFYNKPAA